MKKKNIIIIVAVILLLTIIFSVYFFLIRKPLEKSPLTEKNAFINANIEINCAISFDPDLKSNAEKLNPILTETYKKYEFPTDDNETMLFILKKYENDIEINTIIKTFSDKCSDGKATELYESSST